MNIHPDDTGLFQRVERLAIRLASNIGQTCTVEPKRRPLADGATGLCYREDHRIAIVLRFKDRADDGGRWWTNPLPWGEIRDTVAHEVAHLIHPNHGPEFKSLEAQLKAQAFHNPHFLK